MDIIDSVVAYYSTYIETIITKILDLLLTYGIDLESMLGDVELPF